MNVEKCKQLLLNNTISKSEFNQLNSICWKSQYVLQFLEGSETGKYFAFLKLERLYNLGLISENELNELVFNLGLKNAV